jgi:hypothetical protein
MCEAESRCKPVGCQAQDDDEDQEDSSIACGYFQIKRSYYIECGRPGQQEGESDDAAWKRCADDYDCSLVCVKNYMRKFIWRCVDGEQRPTCEGFARLQQSGPHDCKNKKPNPFWDRVRACYYRSSKDDAVLTSSDANSAAGSVQGQQSQNQAGNSASQSGSAGSKSGSAGSQSNGAGSKSGSSASEHAANSQSAGNAGFTDQKNQDPENDS